MSLLSHAGLQKFSRVVLALALLVIAADVTTQRATATHQPADKIAVSGNSLQFIESSPTATAPVVTLLSGKMKTSSPTDLIFQVTLECSLFTNIVNVGNETSEATATVEVWITVDNVAVPVAGGDNGRVTFCDRTYKRTTEFFSDDEDDTKDTIRDYLRTKSTHGFNWVKLNLGSKPSPHIIAVKATITHATAGNAENFAQAVVGKRTLVVFPAKLANDATI